VKSTKNFARWRRSLAATSGG